MVCKSSFVTKKTVGKWGWGDLMGVGGGENPSGAWWGGVRHKWREVTRRTQCYDIINCLHMNLIPYFL